MSVEAKENFQNRIAFAVGKFDIITERASEIFLVAVFNITG